MSSEFLAGNLALDFEDEVIAGVLVLAWRPNRVDVQIASLIEGRVRSRTRYAATPTSPGKRVGNH